MRWRLPCGVVTSVFLNPVTVTSLCEYCWQMKLVSEASLALMDARPVMWLSTDVHS